MLSSIKFISVSIFPVILSLCILSLRLEDRTVQLQLGVVSLLSIFSYVACLKFIPIVSSLCLKAKLSGFDINKTGDTPIPESLGLVSGTIYLVCIIMFQPLFVERLGEYNAALTSICFMMLLGFADDVLDLRWSIKIGLSFLASLPILVAYSGPTLIIVPRPLQALLGLSIDLGLLYHVYMSLLSVFCTNSINILAGINGLEAGQTLVIACSVLVHGVVEYMFGQNPQASLLPIFLILPFIATTSALLYYNWYPSQVFVGDTFTYLAGMTLAVVGILGHFSKTLMLLFIPQFLNFFISLPQLFGFIPCPRHRLPRYNKVTKKLECIPTNWNLVNLFLYIFGSMTEKELCVALMKFQILCTVLAFFVRHYLSTVVY